MAGIDENLLWDGSTRRMEKALRWWHFLDSLPLGVARLLYGSNNNNNNNNNNNFMFFGSYISGFPVLNGCEKLLLLGDFDSLDDHWLSWTWLSKVYYDGYYRKRSEFENSL